MDSIQTMRIVFWAALIAFPLPAMASTDTILIGGGYELVKSQGQIEQNVLWVEKILSPRSAHLNTFFASGSNQEIFDVTYWDAGARASSQRNPLADLFSKPSADWLRFRHNQVNPSMGSTEKNNLVTGLSSLISKSKSSNIILVYNGHGGYGGINHTENNNLLLWGNTSLNVEEFRQIIYQKPAETNFRFVLTQCYSGGFYQAALNKGKADNTCGFMSQAENLEAEGCELGINKDDFRDYTTYFFAALTGKDRYGEALKSNPDLNNDGKVSFREAHLYTLATALSSDLSRSTSEIYLEHWQPWYLRWQPFSQKISNSYSDIAKIIANKYQIDIENPNIQMAQLSDELTAIFEQQKIEHENAELLRQQIARQLVVKYPFLTSPYSLEFLNQIALYQVQINSAISRIPAYQQLVAVLDKQELLSTKELHLKRELTQVNKLYRMKRLAVLTEEFTRLASIQDKAEYNALLNCEEGHLE